MPYIFLPPLGAGLVFLYPSLIHVWMPLSLALVSLLLHWRCRTLAALWLALLLLGAAYSSWQLQRVVNSQIAEAHEGISYSAVLRVESIPERRDHASRFLGKVLELSCEAGDPCPDLAGQLLRVSWFRPQQTINAGELWQLELRLKRPRGLVNPGGFDYQAWLLSQSIVASASVRGRPVLMGQSQNLAAVRADLKQDLLQTGPALDFERYFSALLVGDKSGLSADDWHLLQRTGTVHLMAISGLHIGLVAAWGYALGAVIKRLALAPALRRYARGLFFMPCLLSVAAAAGYAALAGFALPTVRALIACVCINLALAAGVRLSAVTVVGVCLLAVVVIQPLAWISSGFWLSFLAVVTLVLTLRGRQHGKFKGLLKAQAVLALALFLPLLALGQPVSLVGPLANLLVVPVVSLLVIPLLFVAALSKTLTLGLESTLLAAADAVFALVYKLLEWLAAGRQAVWWPSSELTWVSYGVAVAATLLLLSPAGLRLRSLGVLLLVAVLFAYHPTKPPVRLSVLDVGQGLAAVLETPEATWVYDAGPRFSDSFDAGSQLVAPYLARRGIHRLSLMLSHNDLDHSGGALGLASRMTIDKLLYGEPVEVSAARSSACLRGQTWQEGPVNYAVLWPERPDREGNNSSCVLLVQFEHAEQTVRLLFTGDIDRSVERLLLADLPQVDVLIAAHHGSGSSSSLAFVNRVKPRWVIFSSGHNNRFGHPAEQVIARYDQAGSTMLNTAKDGAVIFSWFDASPVQIELTRRDRRKPWFTSPAAPSKK